MIGSGRARLNSLTRRVLGAANRAQHRIRVMLKIADHGVHAVAMTRSKRIILVRLTYAEGWFCPGGGKKRREAPKEGVLRELREEIGIRSWSTVQHIAHFADAGTPPSQADAFLVRDVEYRPRWSLEIAEVREFALDDLPAGLSSATRKFLAAALRHLA